MANERLARRYAQAIFSLAKDAHAIDAIGGELRSVMTLFDGDANLRDFFHSPVIGRETKYAALTAAFDGKVNTITLHSLLLLVSKRRETLLPEISAAYDQLVRSNQNREALTIVSARPLGGHELETLVERLSRQYKTTFEVRQELDPRLIGGLRLKMGDRSIDASISGRFEELATTLFSQS